MGGRWRRTKFGKNTRESLGEDLPADLVAWKVGGLQQQQQQQCSDASAEKCLVISLPLTDGERVAAASKDRNQEPPHASSFTTSFQLN